MIFLANVVTGFILVILSIFFSRPIMYLPQFCDFFLNFLESNSLILDIYYPILRYLQAFQILLQILFILNRATCVLWPVNYSIFWKKYLNWIIGFLAALPLLWVWTILISEKVVRHAYGGLFVTYVRYFNWARSTFFFAVLRGISVIFIGISTLITVIKMSKMQKRIKESERKLCWASIYLSICYVTPAITEYQFSQTYTILPNDHYLYGLTLITWDIQNIGSTFVMLIVNAPFRKYFFNFSKKKSDGIQAKKAHIIAILSLTH
ncbi:hypothetical protein B9Z55_009143 [Caenorhabditis nigoni]|uniref:Serpentine receptor class gamma n=1 Tax=Caenorhabditis nigoni TaxID=1611254 RepID=A0A2G5UQN5_9PELO|nr:hypothetical protein B9Z55_009143 [Caenorhabditis nigoni]